MFAEICHGSAIPHVDLKRFLIQNLDFPVKLLIKFLFRSFFPLAHQDLQEVFVFQGKDSVFQYFRLEIRTGTKKKPFDVTEEVPKTTPL